MGEYFFGMLHGALITVCLFNVIINFKGEHIWLDGWKCAAYEKSGESTVTKEVRECTNYIKGE